MSMFNRFGLVKEKIGHLVAVEVGCWAVVSLLLAVLYGPGNLRADDPITDGEPKARLSAEPGGGSLTLAPIDLAGGAKLTLISPKTWEPIAHRISRDIKDAHQYFTHIFGEIPAFETSVRLLEQKAFYALTGAPSWTNAMFYRGQIVIPLSTTEPIDYENIYRSVRHEYSHAVNGALTKNRCVGWIDEGLAQLEEGPENPLLLQALQDWTRNNRPVPFRLLQGGFTKLETAMVPAAYAQSLVAANSLVRGFGYGKLRRYFDALRTGVDKGDAFRESFGISEAVFENRLGRTIQELTHARSHR
jgi:hypothetical protein